MAWGRRRVFGVVLTVSLALNLFAVGILIGAIAVAGGRFPPRADGFGPLQASPALMALDQESRQIAIEMFQENESALREETRALRRAQRQVVRTMGADPFDPDAARAALQELRLRTDNIQAVLHDYLVDLSPNLSEDERRRLSRMIFRGPAYRIPLARDGSAPHRPAG